MHYSGEARVSGLDYIWALNGGERKREGGSGERATTHEQHFKGREDWAGWTADRVRSRVEQNYEE